MITFASISSVTPSMIQFVLFGDDVSTTIDLNLNRAPFGIDLAKAPIAGFDVDIRGEKTGITALATSLVNLLGELIVTVTFSVPPPSSLTLGISMTPKYKQ